MKRFLSAHRDVEITEGGDDAAAETHNQGTIRGDHELSCCSHGDASSEGGVLDVHLSGKPLVSEMPRGAGAAFIRQRLTMSSLPRLSCMLESATVVSTQEARPRYVLMAALCCPSPWSVMAELKLGQNIQRNRVPVGRKQRCEASE